MSKAKIAKSYRGATIDFDLIKIKEQIGSTPKPVSVTAREDFVDQKFKRRLKKVKRDVELDQPDTTTDTEAE